MLMPRYPSYTQAWKWFISFWWFIYYESPNIESQFKCGWLSYSEVILIQYLKMRYWIRMYLHAWFVLLTNVILMLCLIWHLDWMFAANSLHPWSFFSWEVYSIVTQYIVSFQDQILSLGQDLSFDIILSWNGTIYGVPPEYSFLVGWPKLNLG